MASRPKSLVHTLLCAGKNVAACPHRAADENGLTGQLPKQNVLIWIIQQKADADLEYFIQESRIMQKSV